MKIAYIKSHYNLCKSLIKFDKLSDYLIKEGYDGAVLCDDTLAGSVDFYKTLTKKKLKPIFGLAHKDSLYIAQNKDGWNDLLALNNDQIIPPHSGNVKTLLNKDSVGYSEPIVYLNKEDARDHRVLLAVGYETTEQQLLSFPKDLNPQDEEYLKSDDFWLKSPGRDFPFEVDDFSILGTPSLPKFDPTLDSDALLKQWCRDGWVEKIQGKKDKNPAYLDRVNYELGVLQGAKLSDYFLILSDICKYMASQGWLTPIGRGSAAGCIVSYLTGITKVDPIQYNLIFERFYNAGRIGSLPDIDLDVQTEHREDIIKYVQSKYGSDRVMQMCTYLKMKGRNAIQDVLRVSQQVTQEERNRITKFIPDESKIVGDLQKMKENGEEPSIIMWALQNMPDKLKQWCYLNDKKELDGRLAKKFEQAIRLEGTIKTRGRHAAGITIASRPLKELCPIVNMDGENVTAYEMRAMEDIGVLKLDVLGVSLLSKISTCERLIESNEIQD